MTPDATTQEDVLFDDNDSKPRTATSETSSEVVARIKISPLSLTIFKRETENGTFYESNLQRAYTRDNGETFEYTSSLRPQDHRKAARLFEKAADKLEGLEIDSSPGGGQQ